MVRRRVWITVSYRVQTLIVIGKIKAAEVKLQDAGVRHAAGRGRKEWCVRGGGVPEDG